MQTKSIKMLAFFMAISLSFPTWAQEADSTGLPGDNFSLEGALELFKKAASPEDFEKSLNQEDNAVNNLDLNEDGEIDYIRVVDNMDGDVHAIVLQVAVNEAEAQDVAVIELEKTGDEEAILQIIGDEEIYGDTRIVEPYDKDAKDDGKGPNVTVDRIVVNVFFWPSVRFVYGPRYKVWVSPYSWRHYPVWFKPWRVHPWRVHHARVVVYRPHYHAVTTHRVVRAHKVYTPHRRTSTVVHTKTTVVKGRNGGVAKKQTTTTTVKGRNGSVTKKTTEVGARGKNGNQAGGKKSKTTVRKKRGG